MSGTFRFDFFPFAFPRIFRFLSFSFPLAFLFLILSFPLAVVGWMLSKCCFPRFQSGFQMVSSGFKVVSHLFGGGGPVNPWIWDMTRTSSSVKNRNFKFFQGFLKVVPYLFFPLRHVEKAPSALRIYECSLPANETHEKEKKRKRYAAHMMCIYLYINMMCFGNLNRYKYILHIY